MGIFFNFMMDFLSRIQKLAENEGIKIGALERLIGASKGVLSRAIANNTDIQSKWLVAIVENYPQYSTKWLLTGEGAMFNNDTPNTVEQVVSNIPGTGIPYYDVDFIGGFDEIFNCQAIVPQSYIKIQGFDKADFWCNVSGHSMEPKINHGDIIALHKCRVEDILYGEIYAVVTDSIRTIKIIRKSKQPGMLRFIPINIENYDEKEYAVSEILYIYKVIGSISKFF